MTEPPAPPQPPSNKVLRCLVGCLLFGVVGVVLVAASAWLLRYEIRAAFSARDARWTLQGELGPADVQDTREVLKRRLKAAGLPATIESGEGGSLVVEFDQHDAERLRFLLLSKGGFRLMIGVDPGDQAALDAARVEEERGAKVRRYALLHWVETSDQYREEPLLVRRSDAIRPQDFAGFDVSLNSYGEPALGFEMTQEGAERLYALTSENVDQHLAMVIGDRVYSAPIIRGAIRQRGIVEGGLDGWSRSQIRDLIAVFEGGELPQPLVIEREELLAR